MCPKYFYFVQIMWLLPRPKKLLNSTLSCFLLKKTPKNKPKKHNTKPNQKNLQVSVEGLNESFCIFLESQNYPWCSVTSGTNLAPDFSRPQSIWNLKQWQNFGDFARSPLKFRLMLQFSIQENNHLLNLLLPSEQEDMKKEKLWQRHQIVREFVCVVYAHHMNSSNGDKSVTHKYVLLITSHKVKMLHLGVPTYLIEYQQKIIQVSMQIAYREQKLFFF